MKKIILISSIITTFLLTNIVFANTIVKYSGNLEQISAAFNSKSAASISSFFENTIEMTLLDKESNYSKNQAEAVLNSFFQNNPPIGFRLNHQGSSPDGSSFGIGILTTSKGNFKVIFYIKSKSNQQLIQELRIEKE
jgi:hypothetical protein